MNSPRVISWSLTKRVGIVIALPLTNTSDFGVQVSFPVISVPAIFTKTAWVEGKTGIASVFLYSHTEHV
ncbi:hypothetical protein [Treponema peruense]|uniref:hypothetical protein n=1 Tax=Treponema peruense TaxID=2787628 RepID=UPI001E52C45C|nr:hypothetical protein [Treponema peruense]